MIAIRPTLFVLALFASFGASALEADPALEHSVQQLRDAIGKWDVVTEFLNPDGSIARSVQGAYEFAWVVPDRVVSGKSAIPELGTAAGILFYIKEQKREIEMTSVGPDGFLWIMTGELGGETRTTQDLKTTGGGVGKLRFTRFNVAKDTFESRMEFTEDGGETWALGNHQTFRRAAQ